MSSENRPTASAEGVGEKRLTNVRDCLEAKRAALNAEIRSYPGPIPACDAQFNYLLEKRTRLSAVLNLVDRLLARCRTDCTNIPGADALIAKINQTDPEMADKLISALVVDSER